jgi:dTDP-4-amino-4,6-dideoxygalactose transaminase
LRNSGFDFGKDNNMILMNDFRAEPKELREAMLHAVGRVLESGWYVLGEEVTSFERQWASICGVSHGVGVGNGMDAIEIALRAMNIGHGDEVITTPMTAFASVLAILRAGAIPVLADINLDSGLLSIESVERCVSPRTKAVLLVHLYGQVRELDAWKNFCDDRNIELLEDCAQAHLATWKGKMAGSVGAAGAFSFYPTKNLGALGDAGMLVTNRQELAQRAACLRNYGQSLRYHHPEIGMNSRLDEVHAAMLSVRLQWLEMFTKRRRQIADAYRARIGNRHVQLPSLPEEPLAHVYHLFTIMSDRRDELQRHLLSERIQSLIHYPVPIHKVNFMRQRRYRYLVTHRCLLRI